MVSLVDHSLNKLILREFFSKLFVLSKVERLEFLDVSAVFKLKHTPHGAFFHHLLADGDGKKSQQTKGNEKKGKKN